MKEELENILKKVARGASFEVLVSEKEEFGHYSTNLAMRLFKKVSGDRLEVAGKGNALELAKGLAEEIGAKAPRGMFERVEAAPPGFINFWLSSEFLQKELGKALAQKDFGRTNLGKSKKVIFEYSDPNIAKRMHVGHLRATIIGDALSNIYEFLGYKVIRWNYIGDWGTQFGKMIAAYKLWGNKAVVQKNPVEELQNLYVKFHEEMKLKPELEDRGREEFKKLEDGDTENRKLWEWFRRESLKEFDQIYKVLGVKFDLVLGEAFYEKDLKKIIADLKKKGIAKKSEGSWVVPLEEGNLPPALIEKADGATLYMTRDIANIKYRLAKHKPAKVFYVVGNEQTFHFEQLFAIAKILGWDKKTELRHIKYGLVLGEDKKKLATREGKTIQLKELIDRVISLARKLVEEKDTDLSAKEKKKVAEAVGMGALKYFDLKENRQSDIVFDWERMLDLRGNSAPYLLYTYARFASILKKSKMKEKGKTPSARSGTRADLGKLVKKEELDLMRKILGFPDAVLEVHDSLFTSSLAKYLYELSNLASRFYEAAPVLSSRGGSASDGKDESALRAARVELVSMTNRVLEKGLGLLGVKALDNI